eukprot:768750-Hanusia_phi.AAC.4
MSSSLALSFEAYTKPMDLGIDMIHAKTQSNAIKMQAAQQMPNAKVLRLLGCEYSILSRPKS